MERSRSARRLLLTMPRTVTFGVIGRAVDGESLLFAPFSFSSITGKGDTWNVASEDSSVAVRRRKGCSPGTQSAAISNLHLNRSSMRPPWASPLGCGTFGKDSIETARMPGSKKMISRGSLR